VTDDSDSSKKVVYSIYNLAEVVILDPLFAVSLPATVTAETGIDTLAHAIESYVSVDCTPVTEILAIEAIRLVCNNLPAAYAKANNIDARFNMLFAATIAGLSWASGGLGATHALAYALETLHHMSHARAVSLMLPYVMDYNKI